MSGKQSADMTTSIAGDVRTSRQTNGRCQERIQETFTELYGCILELNKLICDASLATA